MFIGERDGLCVEPTATTVNWAQLGACGLFAFFVWRALRDQAPALKSIGETLVEIRAALVMLPAIASVLTSVQVTQAALLERERARAERIAAQQAQRESLLADLAPSAPQTWEDETKPIVEAPKKKRAQTAPMGRPIVGAYGPLKPEE